MSLCLAFVAQARQVVRVGAFDNKPIVFKDSDGKISGFAIDLLENIAAQNDWDIEYLFDSWSHQLAALENGEIDLLVGIAFSDERAVKFDFSAQTAINNWGVILQAENTQLTSLQDLIGKRVALMKKSIHSTSFIDTMRGFNFSFSIVDADDYQSALDAVAAGKADAAVVNRVFSLLHGQKSELKETGIIFNPVEVRFAAPKGKSTEILAGIDNSLSLAKKNASSYYYRALNKWLGNVSNNTNYKWIFWVIIVAVTLLALVLVYNYMLSKQVKAHTRQLARSERRYKLAQEAAHIGAWEWDIKHNLVYWSENIAGMFGLREGEFDGKYESYLAMLEEEDREIVTEAVNNAFSNNQGYHVEHKIVWPDGSEHWLSGKGELQRDKEGNPVMMVGIVQDITQKWRTENALRQSEEKYRNLINSTQEGIWVIDENNYTSFANPAMERILGYAVGEMTGKPLFDFMDERGRRIASQNIEKRKQGIAEQHDFEFIRKDGKRIYATLVTSPVFDADVYKGAIAGVIDITARVEAENTLKESEERFRQLAENINAIFWVSSANWQEVLYISPAYETVWGKSCESLIANPLSWLESVHPDDLTQVKEDLRNKIESGVTTPVSYEYRIIRPDKSMRWISARAYPIYNRDGEFYRVAGIAEDVTERRQAELAFEESSRMLTLILDTVPTRVFWKDRNSVFLGCNQLFASDAGLRSPEKIIGKTDFDFNWREQAESYQHDDNKVMTSGQAKIGYEEPQTTPAGDLIWLETSKIPLTDRNGTIIGILGIYSEVTARKQAEDALAKSKAEFEAIFNSISDACIYADETRHIVMVNPAVSLLFGYAPEELIGKKTEMIYADKADFEEQGKRQFNKETSVKNANYEMRYRRKDGSTFIGDTLGTKVFDAQDNFLGMLAIIRDVTERYEAEVELHKHRYRLEELVKERTQEYENINKELEAFSYSVSHDLRAPLRAIDGFSEALREDYEELLDTTGKEYIQRVRGAAQRMSLLIDDLLHLSRVSRSEMEMHEVDLSQVVTESIQRHMESYPGKDIIYNVKPELKVKADKRLLEVVINNLIDNAIKYSQNKKQSVIEFGCQQNNGDRVFFMKDNGAGFDMRYVRKLFTPFQRLHNPAEFEGTGVGLATVKRIITRHGGRVWAEAEEGKGATFHFTLGPAAHGT